MSLNYLVQMGRFVADPEFRTAATGTTVCSFALAVDKIPGKDHQPQEANFFDYVAFGNTAEMICKYFRKGSRIVVEGKLDTNIWTNKEGKKQKSVKIIVSNVSFVDKRSDDQNQGNTDQTAKNIQFDELDDNSAF